MGARGRKGRGRRDVLVAVVALALVALWSGWWSCGFQGCPDLGPLTAYQPGGAPVLLDRYGDPFVELHPLDVEVVPLDSLPPYLPAAFIATEDHRFYRHRGIDGLRVLGAAAANLRAGGVRQGASTLTMQLARTLFPERMPGSSRTLGRKLLEARMAGRIERHFSKNEILELYLNHVYMGGGAYGVAAGARHYFGKPAGELGPEEAALLAAVLRAPAHLDPRRVPERTLERRTLVLQLMVEHGHLDARVMAEVRDRDLGVTPEPPSTAIPGRAPYFVEVAKRWLEEEFGEDLYRSRLTVHTSLDPTFQEAAEEELRAQLEAVESGTFGEYRNPGSAEGPLEGAVVVLDAATGDVLAMVGGRDFGASRFNRATRGRRQMGSAFKPFVYAAALEAGLVLSQPVADRPFTLALAGSDPWSPRNYDGTFRGVVSMRRALVESLNVPTARVALATGLDRVARTAEMAGLPEPSSAVPAVALGVESASPIEMATAYAGLAAGGVRPVPRTIVRVEDSRGRIVRETPVHLGGGMDPRVSHIITDILADVVDRGTGWRVREVGFAGTAAGKTGTTQDANDVWFVGYTPEVAAAVWIGFDQPRAILPGATGGRLAAPVWGRMMARGYEGRDPPGPWVRPSGIVERPVDPETGRVLGPGCPAPRGGAVSELFLEEFVPAAACPVEQVDESVIRRLVDFFRRFGGGSDAAGGESAPSTFEGPSEQLSLDSPLERLLGGQPVPLERDGRPAEPER